MWTMLGIAARESFSEKVTSEPVSEGREGISYKWTKAKALQTQTMVRENALRMKYLSSMNKHRLLWLRVVSRET